MATFVSSPHCITAPEYSGAAPWSRTAIMSPQYVTPDWSVYMSSSNPSNPDRSLNPSERSKLLPSGSVIVAASLAHTVLSVVR